MRNSGAVCHTSGFFRQGLTMGKRKPTCSSTEKDHKCEELAIDIPDNLEPLLQRQCCIYKVPGDLRKLNKEVYTPQFISIGPLHNNNEELAEMETQKSIYMTTFFNRKELKDRKEETWKEFERILKDHEKRIRYCYPEKSELCSNEYVKMILFDAVFIMELFIRNFEKEEKEKKKEFIRNFEKEEEEEEEEEELYQKDYMLTKQWLQDGIKQDLLLLENQLPYFVLDDLFKSAFPDNYRPIFHESSKEKGICFHQIVCKYFDNHIPSSDITVDEEKKFLHFTDLLRHFVAGENRNPNNKKHPKPKENLTFENLCSATKLHEAGVVFEGIKNEGLTNIEFEKPKLKCCKRGKLKMPQFTVSDNKECVIRNLMALEQCHYPSNAYICYYFALMDYLIDTVKDVDLLVEKRVIINNLGSNEEMAKLVNSLCKNITISNFCHYKECEDLNKHYKKRRHRAMKSFRSVYFANIWRGTSTVAAVILLVLTLLQTISAFLALR